MNVYVHIPFCRSRCAYCGFLSHCDPKFEEKYIDAVQIEIERRDKYFKDEKISSIYFGGGTPSFINPGYVGLLLDKLRNTSEFTKNVEVSLEANPENITAGNLEKWKSSGINRISIGVQSFNNEVRKKINRCLDREEVIEKTKLAKKFFKNTGIDLIAGLPGDDLSTLKYGIKIVSEMGINHISLYDLEIVSGSLFAKKSEQYDFMANEEKEKFLINSWQYLSDVGFRQYEISNFCRKDDFCKHNLDFWRGKDYIGFGLGAVSRIDNKIIKNTENFDLYLTKTFDQRVEEISDEDRAALDLDAALRLDFPINRAVIKYERICNVSLKQKLESLSHAGFYDEKEKHLTPKGKILHNSVMSFILACNKSLI